MSNLNGRNVAAGVAAASLVILANLTLFKLD